MSRLDEIERRANAATPGPWWGREDQNGEGKWFRSVASGVPGNATRVVPAAGNGGVRSSEDHAFILHARTDIPYLVARVRELERALEEIYRGPGEEFPAAVRSGWRKNYAYNALHPEPLAEPAQL